MTDSYAVVEAYNRKELAAVAKAIKNMGDIAEAQAKIIGFELAKFAVAKIQMAAGSKGIPAKRIADGGKAYHRSRIGEMAFGFKRQRFSGGGDTSLNYGSGGGPGLLAGWEFGSNAYKQFPARVGPTGRFIFPTLKAIQPSIVQKWEASFDEIVKAWNPYGGE